MGELKKFNLNDFIEKYNTKIFIETGTYVGDGLEYASRFNFNQLYSIELNEIHFNYSKNRFSDYEKIEIINKDSISGLDEILKKINYTDNVLFWLDAHLPNFYFKEYGNDYVKDKNILVPLEEELKVIVQNKDISNDFFIIDDLRIYELGDFESGNYTEVIDTKLYPNGIDFIYNLLETTHIITKDYSEQGYIICTPKI